MRKAILAAAIGAACAILGAASSRADIILGGQTWTSTGTTLQLQSVVPGGNQPLNIQCVICGDNQPQQQTDFGYTNFKNTGSADSLIYFSTNVSGGGNAGFDTVGTPYDGSFLRAYLANNGDPNLTFSIGIDVNDTGQAQTLEAFALLNLTQHTVLAQYSLLQPGGALIPSQNNGTGFPDYTLNGLTLEGLDLTHDYAFFARISGANDGPDSFFIVPQAVPGPIVGAGLPGLIAACFGLAGLARARRRRNV